MPSGKTHNQINITVLLLIIVSFLWIKIHNLEILQSIDYKLCVLFVISFLFGTFYLSPDLDINSSPYKRWGLLRIIWWPYKVLFKHRGISHHPVFGCISIVFMLSFVLSPVLLFTEIRNLMSNIEIIIIILVGIIVSIEMHILADNIF